MSVDELIAMLESNFFGHEKVKIFDNNGKVVDLEKDGIASVHKNGKIDYCLIECGE